MEDLSELLGLIAKHKTSNTRYYGAYRYRVLEQSGDYVSLQSVGAVAGLPDLPMVPKAHGIGGKSESLAPSTLVLVMFEGGDPGAPFVSHILSRQQPPTTITIDVRDSIHLGEAGTPVALAAATDDNISALLAAVNVLNGLATPPKPSLPGLPSVAASKVYAE